jgi:3,5-epimerase/4-reductase
MTKKSILIIGKGYFGQRLADTIKCPASPARINTYADAMKFVTRHKPKVLINCIGHTGKNNVDGCELVPDKTLASNSFVPIMLAEACIRNHVKFVHISSGCIYDYDYKKNRPVAEDVLPLYFSLFYSRTKIYAERALEILSRKYNILIPRIRIPLDDQPHPKNLLTKLLAFKKVIDIPNSISYLPDTTRAIQHLIKTDATGIYNVVNKGGLRYPALLDVYKKFVPDYQYTVMNYQKLPTPRTNLILSTRKLEKTGFPVRPVAKVLSECVKNYLNCL